MTTPSSAQQRQRHFSGGPAVSCSSTRLMMWRNNGTKCSSILAVSLLMLLMLLLLSAPTVVFVDGAPVQLRGLNYSNRKGPDWDPFKCKSYAEILTDLTLLRKITDRIRILSLVDCAKGELVWNAAIEVGMKLYLGLWVGPSPQDDFVFDEEIAELQRLMSTKDMGDGTILGITVGSEAIYREDATEQQMIANLNEGKLNSDCV
jgi:glucan 1,3-beta-glucosidase